VSGVCGQDRGQPARCGPNACVARLVANPVKLSPRIFHTHFIGCLLLSNRHDALVVFLAVTVWSASTCPCSLTSVFVQHLIIFRGLLLRVYPRTHGPARRWRAHSDTSKRFNSRTHALTRRVRVHRYLGQLSLARAKFNFPIGEKWNGVDELPLKLSFSWTDVFKVPSCFPY
jgi:hypothetical protein